MNHDCLVERVDRGMFCRVAAILLRRRRDCEREESMILLNLHLLRPCLNTKVELGSTPCVCTTMTLLKAMASTSSRYRTFHVF